MATSLPEPMLPIEQTMIGTLGIQILEISEDRCLGTMPVDRRTVQPGGVAHGGALISLAETLASLGTMHNIDASRQLCVGQEINASLLRPAPAGSTIRGLASVVHRGRTSMVWDVRLTNDEQKLLAICRCTIAIRPLPARA